VSRGKKLDIFIGADINDGWAEVKESKKPASKELLPKEKHFLHFQKEKRRGKVVTLVGPFALADSESTTLLKNLKKKLGCGGAFKDGFMEFQGEPKVKLKELLLAEGFRFKAGH